MFSINYYKVFFLMLIVYYMNSFFFYKKYLKCKQVFTIVNTHVINSKQNIVFGLALISDCMIAKKK